MSGTGPGSGPGPDAPAGELILVADDSRTAVKVLEFALQKAGYSVITAADGQQALDAIRESRPRLVILDGMMPLLDGFQVAAAVRADASLQPQPHLIMVTAEGRDEDRKRAIASGIDDFLWKPFSPSDLLAKVRAGLGG